MTHNRYTGALLLAALSGAAALSHELLWTRRLIDLLGASTESSSRVLGCFFVGLAFGSAWSTRLTRRVTRPWRALAVAELCIALLTLPAVTLPAWTDWLWPWLGPEMLTTWVGATVKLVVSVLVVIPPAFVMGVTLPLFAAAVLKGDMALGRHGVWLYAMNTAGGVAGLLVTTIVVLHRFGVAGSMGVAMAMNLLVAAGCAMLDDSRAAKPQTHRQANPASPQPELNAAASGARPPLVVLFMAFASGAGVLGVEVLGLHLFGQVAPSAVHAVAAVLASVILLLAIAAAVAPVLAPRIDAPQRLLVPVLAFTGIATAAAPLLFMWMTNNLVTIRPSTGVALFVLKITFYVLCTLGPCMLLAGLVLPLVFAWFAAEGGDPYGRRWGWLLAVNGVGGLVGTIAAQRLVMPVVGMHGAVGVFGLGYAGLAVVMALTNSGWRGFLGSARQHAAVLTALLLLGLIWASVGQQQMIITAMLLLAGAAAIGVLWRLYLWWRGNPVGPGQYAVVAGAVVTLAWVSFQYGERRAVIVAVFMLMGFGLWMAYRAAPPVWRQVGVVALILVIGVDRLLRLPLIHPAPTKKIQFKTVWAKGGPEGLVVVTDSDELGRAIVMFNQYVLGSTAGVHDEQRQAHLPIMLHPQPRSVAFIGLATGITAGAALMHDEVESVTAVELSELVAEASERYFADANGGIFTDPRARVVIEDGRTYLASCVERFDVVVGDLFLPWRPGVGRLYSLEHFRAARRALRPRGLFCQMLPMYQFSRDQQQVVLNTFLQVFPKAHLFRLGFNAQMPVLAMVGMNHADLDWQAIARHCDRVRQDNRIRDPLIRHWEGVAMLHLGPVEAADTVSQPVNTLGNTWIELNAGRDFVTGLWEDGYFMNGRNWLVFEDELAVRFDTRLPNDSRLRRLSTLGAQITRWDRQADRPTASNTELTRKIRSLLPEPITSDANADLTSWHGWRMLMRR